MLLRHKMLQDNLISRHSVSTLPLQILQLIILKYKKCKVPKIQTRIKISGSKLRWILILILSNITLISIPLFFLKIKNFITYLLHDALFKLNFKDPSLYVYSFLSKIQHTQLLSNCLLSYSAKNYLFNVIVDLNSINDIQVSDFLSHKTKIK